MRASPRTSSRLFPLAAAAAGIPLFTAGVAHAQYDAPTSYYSTTAGLTGSALQSQLRTIASNMTGISYGDARFSAPYTDADPAIAGHILLVYDRASVPAAWDVGATWNREHVWPDSRLGPGADDPGNSTISIATDQFNLRPATPSVNSSRSNAPFGPDTGSGAFGFRGSVFYPGDADRGDVARGLFYMATRYSTLSLTDASPSGTQMGDLSALLHFHYKDVPDAFERRRNHAIFGGAGDNSPAISNPYKQGNRNPFVDHPEYAWSVYADQQNDTRLSVAAPGEDGASTAAVDLGRILRGAPVPAPKNITLSKAGVDGTYYSVTPVGAATSSITGRLNAFAMDAAGSQTLAIGLNASTAVAGTRSGLVTIDNLDITTQGGAGRGANDANDVIQVSLTVLDPANPGFTPSDADSLSLDFGTIPLGQPAAPIPFSIRNLPSSAGAPLTAGLDLDAILASGDTSALSTNLAAFTNLPAGEIRDALIYLDTSSPGAFNATYTLMFSDEDLPGATGATHLSLNVHGVVAAVPEPSGLALLALAAPLALRRRRRAGRLTPSSPRPRP